MASAASNEQTRKQRLSRLGPHLEALSAEQEPRSTDRTSLLQLIQDLKDEGNEMFKEKQYEKAASHYKQALFVSRVLEDKFYHDVEGEFLATLYSNGSLAFLKLNKFEEALFFAENAQKLQPDNSKARYRRALALEGLKRYREALTEAKEGVKTQPSVFKSLVAKLEEQLVASRSAKKSVVASAAESVTSPQSTDSSNEWLAGTNALKTEKQRQAVLDKMPGKKNKKRGKGKAAKPVLAVVVSSSDTDSDSDSNEPSVTESIESSASNSDQKNKTEKGKPPGKVKSQAVRGNPSESDPNADALEQRTSFAQVGASSTKSQHNGMGLDDFGGDFVLVTSKNKSQQPQGASASKPQSAGTSKAKGSGSNPAKLPPVDIQWPLGDTVQFTLACRTCFEKVGEGYKGYNYRPNPRHRCDRDILITRRKDSAASNWMKIRPLPELQNSRFNEFKMCQQFQNAQPCKIVESKCTFPHNKNEKHLWYMEVEETFCHSEFMEALHKHNINTSEELAARRPPEKAAVPHIPGLNFKHGARQRLSSPAPLAEPPSQLVARTSQQSAASAKPSTSALAPGPPPSGKLSVKTSLLGAGPSHLLAAPASRNGAAHQPPIPLLSLPVIPPSSSLIHQAYDINIVCPFCLRHENLPGRYRYMPSTHECEENVLAVRPKNVSGVNWMRVRERINHRDFSGRYVMCHSIYFNDPNLCHFGELKCSYAHNEAEQQIWGWEKEGKLSIADFILQNRKASSARSFTLVELMKKHGGFFDFVCRACFYGRFPILSRHTPQNTCSGPLHHRWDVNCILAHFSNASDMVALIEARTFTNRNAFFRICKFLQFCRGMVSGECLSAHSVVERDVWMLERDTNISRALIVQTSQGKPPEPPRQQPSEVPQATPQTFPNASQTPAPDLESLGPKREKVPSTVREFCGMCWSNGTRSMEDGTTNRCVKGHSNFKIKRVFLILGIYRELRNLPTVIPRNLNFTMCRFIQQKKRCQFPESQGVCQFAHSEEERVLWIWMARHKVTKLEEVVKQCIEDNKPAKINQGDSVVTATTVKENNTQARTPFSQQKNTYYCCYCSVQTNSKHKWDEHCASEEHNNNVNSDKDHQWNFRQPPWTGDRTFSLCASHMNGGCCQYSTAPDMHNYCMQAHSQDELDEWRERYEWRRMKITRADEQDMCSYMKQLLNCYNSADSRVSVISETLAGVTVGCGQPLVEYRQEKNATLLWTFIIQTQRKLEKVALLHRSARLHFSLQYGDGSKHQILAGEYCKDVDQHGRPCYKVNVFFTGGMFGSYSQWVVFDFGVRPVLVRKLNVELGQKSVQDKVKDLRQRLAFDRWTGENRQVIPFQYSQDAYTLSLMQRYKEPSAETVVTQNSVRELNQYNYRHKMHGLLDLEEITRHKLISRFNMVSKAEVWGEADIDQCNMHHNRRADLYMHLTLTDNLTEETGAGRLILTNVNKVLLTRNNLPNKHRVYEALIEGKGKDYVIISLSPTCVRELGLHAGMTVEVEVQFQINRMHFVNMHHALDCLEDTDVVFPDISKINPRVNEQHVIKVSSRTLNEDQMKAVHHIVVERTGYTPPFIMYGPFGTGKTETLAQAAMVLLRERHDARILICAQSNSAADLYITKHLDPFLRKAPGKKNLLLRIVSKDRRIFSVPEGSRKYCCYSPDKKSFEIPTAEQVSQYRIVVTTVEMSLRLFNMKLKGSFTHIFIDEAAQALECETVMPLTLASDKTCVVLTGDHLQISPRVYSAEARRQNFGMSMLERLYQYYTTYRQQLQSMSMSLNIFLSINYRTKMEILRFISSVFYGGPKKLTAGSSIPSVVELTPLQFYAVMGREEQAPDSTSYMNVAECSEVVERVISLLDDWPREWGKVAPEEIGVLTPYMDQVKQIRTMLKNCPRSDVRAVNVEPVQNIQGKEFRALFISTVRTKNLLESEHVAKALQEAESTGGVTDFAFLSDRKLLNTAMTRTKSLVVVVGDPLALTAIGDCIQIWRTYLKHCSNMRSIQPPHMSYDNIKNQVISMQMSPIAKRLAEVQEMFDNPILPSSSKSSPLAADRHVVGAGGDTGHQEEVYVDDMEPSFGAGDAAALSTFATTTAPLVTAMPLSTYTPPLQAAVPAVSAPALVSASPLTSYSALAPMSGAPLASYRAFALSSGAALTSYSAPSPPVFAASPSGMSYNAPSPMSTPPLTSYNRPPRVHTPILNSTPGVPLRPVKPMPLKPLGKYKLPKPVIEEFKSVDFYIKADEILVQLAMETVEDAPLPLKVECIQVKLEDGQAVVSYNEQLSNKDKRLKLLQAAATGKEFECDSEIQVRDEDTGTDIMYCNYTEQTLQAVLRDDPRNFKRCIIHVREDGCVAEVINPSDSVEKIEVYGALSRGPAFDQDEVLVGILPEEEVGTTQYPQGRVMGILHRAVDHRYRTFICYADVTNTSVLTPVTPGTPCVYNVTLRKHAQQVKNGYVCVYQLGADNTLKFSHYEKVEASNAKRKLFVVRYLKWLPGFFHPMGVVVGVVPEGNNLKAAQKIVDIEHNVPAEFSAQAMEEVQSSYNSNTLPTEMYSDRMNLTQTWSFTIDSRNTPDLQVAFSIDQMSDTSYQVCVHVTDVASFVRSGTALDTEALQRGASLLRRGRSQAPLLPSQLSSELCSLRPGQDRCALSIFMVVAGSGEEWRVVQTTLHQTIINSKQHFSHQDVDNILDDIQGAESDYLKSCILVLYQITNMQRQLRKGTEHLYPDLSPAEMLAPRSHQMVQEVLTMANHQVATLLLKAMPQRVPLLQQNRPNGQQLEVWRSQHAADAINSVALTKPFLEGNMVCTCGVVCMCVFSYMHSHEVMGRDNFDILTSTWRGIVEASSRGLTQVIKRDAACMLTHPQAVVARQKLLSLIPSEHWVCSGDVDRLCQGHYSMNLPCLTNITSPLRNYVSIIVQRLVLAMIADQPSPYSQPEITKLMAACNSSQHRADSFATADERVQLAVALQSRPLTLFPVVEKLGEKTVRLCFPNMQCVPEHDCDISLITFSPSASSLPKDGQVKVTMQRRIYDPAGSRTGVQSGGELCADRFVCHIPPFQWQQLLAALREEDEEKQLIAVRNMESEVREASSDGQYTVDVSSEAGGSSLLQHFSEFSLSLHPSMVLKAQLSAQVTRGVLTPQLQLLSLTPTLDICVEHHRNPSTCFVKFASCSSVLGIYRDEGHYQQCLLPILALEAAETAVCSHESVIVHNVTIVWKNQSHATCTGGDLDVSGQFSLSQAFCKERHIFPENENYNDLKLLGLESSVLVPMDLLCVRYKDVEMADNLDVDEQVSAIMKSGTCGSWVAHCVVDEVIHDAHGLVSVRLHLLSSSVKIPPQLFDVSRACQLSCTVEVIPKTTALRHMEYSIAGLTSASRFARDIAVGRIPFNNIEQTDVTFLLGKVDGQMNAEQKKAIETALKQPFTVIEGPPGCGKTRTAVQLALLFVQRNRMTARPISSGAACPQVLICSASDAALDAFAAQLKLLTSACPQAVRVYDKRTEQRQYPVPRGTVPPSKLKPSSSTNGEQQSLGLHHIIRSSSRRYQPNLKQYDDLFSQYHALVDTFPDSFTDDQIANYELLVDQAEVEELYKAEIILATCSNVACARMVQGTNVKQIIIDSSESCTEVESLLPVILLQTTQQLVLLGDRQQLTPTVASQTARAMGLGRSLLERYGDMAISLSKQYRLTQNIAALCSQLFYSGGPSLSGLGSGPAVKSLAFYHVSGPEEEVCMTTTDDGVVESVCNTKEAESVALIVQDIVNKGVDVGRLAVLTQYAAQVQLIRQQLALRQLGGVAVLTVTQSQGSEYDFVVFSTCRSLSRNKVTRGATHGWLQRHLGETADVHQMNVAFTRARKVLVITGNKYLLQCHDVWGRLLNHCRQEELLMA